MIFRAAALVMALALGTCSATAPATAANRDYLMRGLGGLILSNGMDQLGAKLRKRGDVVTVGKWEQWKQFAADALRHPKDTIYFIGHSQGAAEAVAAANYLITKGLKVHVIGIDPLCTHPVVNKGVDAVNFFRSNYVWGDIPCNGLMYGAVKKQTDVGYLRDSHIYVGSDPRMHAIVLKLTAPAK